MDNFFNNLLKDISDVASIIGVLFTAFILIEIKIIKRKFLFKARIPELLRSLKNHAKEISQKLNDFDDSMRDIETNLTRCSATLKNLKSKVDRNTGQTTQRLIKRIQKRHKPLQKEDVWKIYNDLQALIDSLSHLQKDIKWS